MKTISLEKLGAVRVSYDVISELNASNYNKQEINYDSATNKIHEVRAFFLELLLPLHVSNYAALGARYVPVTSAKGLCIEVRCLDDCKNIYESTLAYQKSNVFKGLPIEYADSVIKAINDHFLCNDIPSGKIIFDSAAFCEIGSSSFMFNATTKMVLSMLLNEQYPCSDDYIKEVCRKNLSERYENM